MLHLSHADLSAPYFGAVAPMCRAFIQHPNQENLATWLNDYFTKHHLTPTHHTTHQPLTFVNQDDLPHGTAYETFIHTTANIPTRNNLHDWFGACIWANFPKSKSLLNAKHIQYLQDNQTKNKRNRTRDTITVFDENGAILVVSDDDKGRQIATALHRFDWQTCLVDNRSYWANYLDDTNTKAQVFIFGHALLEQLITPFKSLCSHTLTIYVADDFFKQSLNKQLAILDDLLCQKLDNFLNDSVTPHQLNPLPILGVPYFWQNDNITFYQDEYVFRKGRRNR